jgi:predicted secreted protein
MGIFEGIVVFIVAWWLVFLPILSAGTRSQHEANAVSPGTERGAPEGIRFLPKILFAAGGAAGITFLVWLVIRMGWLNFMISGN